MDNQFATEKERGKKKESLGSILGEVSKQAQAKSVALAPIVNRLYVSDEKSDG